MNWTQVATELWNRWAPRDSLDDTRAVLVRVNSGWTTLELLGAPEWTDGIIALDATSFEFEPRASVSLAPWLDQLDRLEPKAARWRTHAWALRFSNPADTEAAQACLDSLIGGLRDVALELASRLGAATERPIAVLTGLAREVGVVTVSARRPALVLPVTAGGERAYVSLLEGAVAELSTQEERRPLQRGEPLEPGYRGAEDAELWEVPEGREALALIERHLAGTPATFPTPTTDPLPPRPADPPLDQPLIVELERALGQELSGPDADALFQPGIGGLGLALQPSGFRLFFSPPRSVLGALFGRPLARLEVTSETLKLDPQRPWLGRALVGALPHVPCLKPRLAGRVFVSERGDGPVFDVDCHHLDDRPWSPERA